MKWFQSIFTIVFFSLQKFWISKIDKRVGQNFRKKGLINKKGGKFANRVGWGKNLKMLIEWAYLHPYFLQCVIITHCNISTYLYCTYIFAFFRDNGITVQILKYQLYCEGFMFLLVLFTAIIPIENDVLVYRIVAILYSFVVLVMQPLFYLNGDVNFRNRVLQQGLWKALDRELFQRNTQIQPIAPWGKRIQKNSNWR